MKFLHAAAAIALAAATACTPAHRQPAGNPEEPYPPSGPSLAGEIIHLPTGYRVTMAQMIGVAGDGRITYVGEAHDNLSIHRLERTILEGLHDRYPGQVALGMEMFTPSQQKALDRFISGETDEKGFLRESRWYDTWKMDFDYYRDLLLFAREKAIPVIGLNAEQTAVAQLRDKAPEELEPAVRGTLPEMDFSDPYQRALVESIFAGHSHGRIALDGFVRAQVLRDETMAESVVRYLSGPAGQGKKMLVVAGGHHVDYGFGIPRRVFRRMPVSYTIVGSKDVGVPEDRLMDVETPSLPMPPAHFRVTLKYEDLPVRVRLGVMMEPAGKEAGVKVMKVLAGSNAERAGIRQGDVLRAFDGERITDSIDLLNAVKGKKEGDRGVLRLERQGEMLEVPVTFATEGEQGGK